MRVASLQPKGPREGRRRELEQGRALHSTKEGVQMAKLFGKRVHTQVQLCKLTWISICVTWGQSFNFPEPPFTHL